MKANLNSKFSRNVLPKQEQEQEPETPAKAARGTAERVGIAVRVSRADWRLMHEFANEQNKSLNALLIEGFQALQRAAKVPPISGK